jgi:hypothetical protein
VVEELRDDTTGAGGAKEYCIPDGMPDATHSAIYLEKRKQIVASSKTVVTLPSTAAQTRRCRNTRKTVWPMNSC